MKIRYLTVIAFCILCISGCLDDQVEGVVSETPVQFKALQTSMTYNSINNCDAYAPLSNGTVLYAMIDYQGTEGDPVYLIEYTCQATDGPVWGPWSLFRNDDFTDTNAVDGATRFRATKPVKTRFTLRTDYLNYCWRWGNTTFSVKYTFILKTESGNTSTIVYTLNRPTGAN